MNERKVLAVLLVLVLFALSGCTWFAGQTGPPLTVVVSTDRGRPQGDGLSVTFTCSGGTGTYELSPGDGTSGLSFDSGVFTYVYKTEGTHTAVVSSGGGSQSIDITLINRPPVVYPGRIVVSSDWMEKVKLFAEYREHGCDNGMPLWATGVYDPDGDPVVYEWIVTGPDKAGQTVSYTVFNSSRQDITGQRTPEASSWVFFGWTKPDPPYPFGTQSLMCEPVPIPPVPIPGSGTVTITLRAYDPWGGVGEASWTESLTSGGCSSSP